MTTNPLRKWLDEHDVSFVKFAKRVKCSDVHVSRICNDDPRVSTELALRIFKETGVRIGPLKTATPREAAIVAKVLQGGVGE